MVFWEWNESYLLNINRIDTHHQKLVTLVNHLYAGVFACENISHKQALIGEALAELIDYTYYHFSAEEELFIKYKYPDYLSHKEEHEQFKLEINQLMEEYQKGTLIWSFEIFVFLKEWIINHILKTDKKYGAYLIERM